MHNLEVNKIYIKNINPNKENPRQINNDNINKLTNSLNEFGLVEPIIINTKTNEIIGGHQRYKILLDEYNSTSKNKELFILNLGDISWVFSETDLKIRSKDHEAALNITLNNDMAMGVYDESLLYEITSDLQEKGLLSLTQFEDSDLEELQVKLKTLEDEETEIIEYDYDFDQEIPFKVNLGDIWQLGNHRLMCGDSCKNTHVNELLDNNLVDMVVTDPPYNVDYNEKETHLLKHRPNKRVSEGKLTNIQNDKLDDDSFYKFLTNSFINMFNSLKEGASIYVFHSDIEGINFRKAFVDVGFKLSLVCIWVKNHLVLGRQDYHGQHEPVLYGWKPGKAHNWYADRKETTVWEYDKPLKNQEHPTMKPIELISYPIINSSKRKDKILDLFGGSGSTLIACEQLERNCYMMELDPKYCDVIINRWEEFTGEKATKIN